MKKEHLFRGAVYVAGVLVLAFGVTLNTRTGLGVSAVVSVPYSISLIGGWALGAVTFLYYCACVILQFLLGRRFCRPLLLILQVPMALAASTLIGWFDGALPSGPLLLWERLALLAAAIVCTGVGGAMIVDMALVPNPADALADVVGKVLGRGFGFGKNVMDALCVVLTCAVGLLSVGRVVGVQLGTVLCAVFIGRVIALFNRFFKIPLCRGAGLEQPADAAAERGEQPLEISHGRS